MAPRALLVQQCAKDGLFPLEGMQAAVKEIAAVYTKAGGKDKFTGRFYDVPHKFSAPCRTKPSTGSDSNSEPKAWVLASRALARETREAPEETGAARSRTLASEAELPDR